MEITNTVTIPIDEYFEMRQKCEMNAYLLREFGSINARLEELQQRFEELKWNVEDWQRNHK